MAIRATEEIPPVAATRRWADAPLAAAAIHILSERVETFRRRAKKAAAKDDPERIHDLRVASRRLREGLALFEPLFPPSPYRRQYRWVRGVARRLGDARNADVARELCAALLRDTTDPACASALAFLAKRYERDRADAADRVGETLSPRPIREGCAELLAFIRAARLPLDAGSPHATLASHARPLVGERLARVEDLARPLPGPGEAEALHRLRIALKKLRYAIEALEDCYDGAPETVLEVLRRLQDHLGRIHDFDVLSARAAEERDRAAGRPRLADRGLALDLLRSDLAQRRLDLYGGFRDASATLLERDLRRLVLDPLHA